MTLKSLIIHLNMARNPELIGFIPTIIKKPDAFEAWAITDAQAKNIERSIICIFNAGVKEEYTKTVMPARHRLNGMEQELDNLANDMSSADLVQILDSEYR